MLSAILTEGWSLQAVAAFNAILAWVAACVHGWAAYKTSGLLRKMFIAISALAFFYCLSYWWLAFNPEKGGDWSEFLRPFGIFTWVVAWAIEPIVLIHYVTRRGDEIVAKAEAAVAPIKEKLGE